VTIFCTAARAAAVLASATMLATPALAATRTVPVSIPLSADPAPLPVWTPADDTAEAHRWHRYRHHGDGIDGGDLLGGLLVIGGIAAVAAAIDKDQEERRGDRTQGHDYPYRDAPGDYRDADRDVDHDIDRDSDRDYGRGPDRSDNRAADRAVEACSAEAARTGRVDEIYDVDNVDGEWRVRGDYANGREFTCTVDSSGRAYVGFGDRSDASDPEPRAERVTPGDEDDRYATSGAPDFEDSRSR